jgi:hypothetical protein
VQPDAMYISLLAIMEGSSKPTVDQEQDFPVCPWLRLKFTAETIIREPTFFSSL